MKRRTHRSNKGPKLYRYVKNDKGRFRDIETYRRAHEKSKPKTAAEERLIRAAIHHVRPHKETTEYGTFSWMCSDPPLQLAVAEVLRERGE
jgi:hypothetical protein